MSDPPPTRAMALACTMHALRAHWLHICCGCGCTTAHPVRLMLLGRPACAGHSLAAVLSRLRCARCSGAGRLTTQLCERAPGQGWTLLLHDASAAAEGGRGHGDGPATQGARREHQHGHPLQIQRPQRGCV